MNVTAIKTDKIKPGEGDIFSVLDSSLQSLKEGSVLAITSKIISITEGSVVKIEEIDKEELVKSQSQLYLSGNLNSYGISLSVKDGHLIAHAGIDESNGAGFYVLWPKDPQQSANKIRAYLKNRFKLNKAGVIITDSRTTPLEWGTTGFCIAYSGFRPLKDYIGEEDIFGRKLQYTKSNLADGLAACAVVTMGEGAEQTPLAIVDDLPFIEFTDEDPTKEEIASLKINLEDDIYSPLLTSAPWEKGQSS